MINNKHAIVLFVFLLFIMLTPLLNAESLLRQRLVWSGGENALHFAVEIEKSENGIYRKYLHEYTQSHYLNVSLQSGEYRFRIIPYDILGRPAEGSRWINIEINSAISQSEEAQRFEYFVEQRTDVVQQLHEGVIIDQQESGVFFFTIERQTPAIMGRGVMLDPSTGRELRRSPTDFLIHSRTVTFIGERLFAIAGENVGNIAVRLIEVNPVSLEIINQGLNDIRPGSLLWVNGNDLYAITIDLRNNHCFIGRFNTDLVLQARSRIRVHPEASIIVQRGILFTHHVNGSALMLNPIDLSEIR